MQLQTIGSDCIELLHAITSALSDWSASVSRAMQQQRWGNKKQRNQLLDTVSELRETGIWLPAAAGNLLSCMREYKLYDMADGQQLLYSLGQLLRRVRRCLSLP